MKKLINQNVIGKILKTVRGDKSQGFINLEMGHKSNQIAKWENGSNRILWKDFVNLCEIRKIPISKILSDYYRYSGDILNQKELVTYLIGGASMASMAKASGLSPHKLRRLAGGQSPLYLVDLLQLIESTNPFQICSFLGQIFPLYKVKELYEANKMVQQMVNLTYKYPETAPIYAGIELFFKTGDDFVKLVVTELDYL